MKPSVLLVPIAFLSTTLAWNRNPPPTHAEDPLLPAKNRRYDYKQSLKKPFMYNGAMPFWEHIGNAFVALDFIRLAPSVPGLRGAVWRSAPNEYKEWEAEFSFKAHGQNYVGGKGLAFWYTQERAIEGPVFGNGDKWKGLGVFMDTSDPANQRLNSIIYAIINDGTKSYQEDQESSRLGGCLRDYKNSPVPVVIRVSYISRTLRVAVDTMNKGSKLMTCFERNDIDLPAGYHFGFSAESASTGTPDDHDLFSFEVYEVNPPLKTQKHLRPHEEEMIRKGEEVKVDESDKLVFEEVKKIVEEQQQKIQEEIDGPNILSAAQLAATVSDTQFRIVESLNTIHKKLESLGAPIQPHESTSRSLEEINKQISSMTGSLHAMENVVKGLVDHIIQQGRKNAPEITKVLKEELKSLNAKMEDIDHRQSYQHQLTQTRLVNSSSWFSYVAFLILLQLAAMVAYNWYKRRLELNEKKFI
ncbi:legume-like lectin family-domain-containing protein [Gamsiella multidivaricata]|uniref:legume-like lectin family-domain-containing protein n=1 Tax=Gamsiella multidivaricata TaxID=101098 RepID=UPI00221FB646|nr:legume-like lectin family-domain-containing protein [Gamsiella multidivaricata]KAG0369153.1 hypothetical protein BGZ54_000205 [Gamsiella multidivaricata]KAI7829749.1 legume-like lectin family-domain-containing protein [Gamsiella multidivaricata]